MQMAPEQILAAATGSDGGLGKIGTIPNNGVIYVRAKAGARTRRVDWVLQIDKTHDYQLYRSREIAQTVTLTLDSIADGETLTINGLTFTAEDTEEDAVASSRKFWTGDTGDAEDAAALAALINNATYGVPGVTATSALGVVTVVPDEDSGAPVIQAATGTAGAHCAVADNTLANLEVDGSAVTSAAANNTTAGKIIAQAVNYYEYAYIGVTNKSGAAAATAVVKAACSGDYGVAA